MADPDSIPVDVLELLASKLASSIQNFVRFGAVCRSWRLATLNLKSTLPSEITHSPWIMLHNNSPEYSHRFYSVATGENFNIQLPEAINRSLCWGSPFGWIFVHGMTSILLNPITKASIALPSLISFLHSQYTGPIDFISEFYFIASAILTASPDSPYCILFVIHSYEDKLVYIRPGEPNWSTMEGEGWIDIISFKGELYACLRYGTVLIISSSVDSPSALAATDFAEAPYPEDKGLKYLVDLGGELCMVIRFAEPVMSFTSYKTLGIEIYRIDICTKIWERVLSLDGKCIFLGDNYSYATQAFSYRLSANCVYSSDEYYGFDIQIGEFDIDNDRIKPYTTLRLEGRRELYPSDIYRVWFTPKLN